MAQKKKQTVWHKRRATFVPAASLKARQDSPRAAVPHSPGPDAGRGGEKDRQAFFRRLSEQIKRAARARPGEQG